MGKAVPVGTGAFGLRPLHTCYDNRVNARKTIMEEAEEEEKKESGKHADDERKKRRKREELKEDQESVK